MCKYPSGILMAFAVLIGGMQLHAADLDSAGQEKLLNLTNALRKTNQLPPLRINRALAEAARKHAANMADQEKMDHVLDGKNHADRAKAAAYAGMATGENIATSWGRSDNAQTLFDSWESSPPHRGNMLGSKYAFDEIGIGVAVSRSGRFYACQVFGVSKPVR